MLFPTFTFLIFFLILLAFIAVFRGFRERKFILLVASYIFYMWWNPACILLIIASTALNYVAGLLMERRPGWNKWTLIVSVVFNLGLLGVFKYANFFEDNLIFVLSLFGIKPSWTHLNVILPVGISFYTFQTMSYTIDRYRGHLPTCHSSLDFALFVSFFPQLVAGPIVRAADFLPQLDSPRKIRLDRVAILRILRGLFKKVIIADNLGFFADNIFADPGRFPSSIIVMAVVCFSVQIYCDFSGYSEIAIGIGRILGYRLPENFNRPYFSGSPSEFWQRWHISLSSWLRDYLYIPLGGNRHGTLNTYRNIMITMLLGGIWHGASWNFVLWGFLHGIIQIVYHFLISIGVFHRQARNMFTRLCSVLFWQYFVLVTWITFRMEDTQDMLIVLRKFICFEPKFGISGLGLGNYAFFSTLLILAAFWVLHAYSNYREDLVRLLLRANPWFTAAVFFLCGWIMFFFWPLTKVPFIYFQF